MSDPPEPGVQGGVAEPGEVSEPEPGVQGGAVEPGGREYSAEL